MKLVEINCYVCGSYENQFYDEENGFRLVKCCKCGLVYLSPRPSIEDISNSAMAGLHSGTESINVTGNFDNSKISTYLNILNDFFSTVFKNNDNWLDVGCGHGEFLLALKIFTNGTVLGKGSEPNKYKVESARKKGLDVSFFDLDKHSEKYSYISMLNVYSHLPNPIDTLICCNNLLKENGILFLETGHSCHLEAKYHHKPYYLPDHLSFANCDILKDILNKVGFEIEQVIIYRHPEFPEFNIKNILLELAKLFLFRKHRLNKFSPKEPNRDMYIKAIKR